MLWGPNGFHIHLWKSFQWYKYKCALVYSPVLFSTSLNLICWIISGHCLLMKCPKKWFCALRLFHESLIVSAEEDRAFHFWAPASNWMKSFPFTAQMSKADLRALSDTMQPRRRWTSTRIVLFHRLKVFIALKHVTVQICYKLTQCVIDELRNLL